MTYRRNRRRQAERTEQPNPFIANHPFADQPDAGGVIPDGSRHFVGLGVDDEHAAPEDGSVRYNFGDDADTPAAPDDGTVNYGRVFAVDQ